MLSFASLAVLLLSILYTVFALPLSARAGNVSDPLATLSYGTFQGRYSSAYNITYFRKIPFAAPPVGINRFRAPQPVDPITNGTYDSDGTFAECPQRTMNGSEDCLFLGLYSRPWTQSQPLRPVVVNFFGGAYIEGGGSFIVPPPAYPVLNVSTENDFVMVEPNYRVNAFGFLPGTEIAEDPNSDLNPGLLDQHAVLKWVNNYITAFGGDPSNVTIWGQSAGAGSVVAQSIASPSYQKGLITRALTSSPFWAKTYHYSSPEAESVYQSFAALANCSGANSLACLKAAPLQTLITAALAVSSSHTYNTSSYTWAPVIGDSFLPLPLSQASPNIQANLQSSWGMYNTHEGQNFIPPSLANASTPNPNGPKDNATSFNSSTASFDDWLHGFLPDLPQPQFDQLTNTYYPPSGSSENIPSYNDTYTRAGLIFRDLVLACPTYWLASSTAASTGSGYLGEYTIPPATHASDTQYWNQVNSIQQTQPLIYDGFAGAFGSYFGTGDPNQNKLTNASEAAVPLLEGTNRTEWVIESDGFDTVGIGMLEWRCAFWKSVADFVDV